MINSNNLISKPYKKSYKTKNSKRMNNMISKKKKVSMKTLKKMRQIKKVMDNIQIIRMMLTFLKVDILKNRYKNNAILYKLKVEKGLQIEPNNIMNKRCVNQIIMIKRISTDQSQVNYFIFLLIF